MSDEKSEWVFDPERPVSDSAGEETPDVAEVEEVADDE